MLWHTPATLINKRSNAIMIAEFINKTYVKNHKRTFLGSVHYLL